MFKGADVPVSFLEVFFINRLIRTKIFSTELCPEQQLSQPTSRSHKSGFSHVRSEDTKPVCVSGGGVICLICLYANLIIWVFLSDDAVTVSY